MCRVLILAVILCSVQINLAFEGSDNKQVSDSYIDVITVKNATKYFQENLNNNYLQLNKTILNRTQIRYTLGRRVSGDQIVASNSQSQQWGSVQDITLTVTYPRIGTGAIVSFVDIIVDQSSNLGQAYVTSGGIGQRRISIIVEAYRTLYFKHVSQFYGLL